MDCSEPLQNKIKNSTKWENISATQNCIDLAEVIKVLVFKYEEDQYMSLSILNAKSVFYMFSQGSMQLSDYREKYSNLIQVLVSYRFVRVRKRIRFATSLTFSCWHMTMMTCAKNS